MKSSLKEIIRRTIAVEENDLEFALSLFEPVFLKKEEFFLKSGSVCNEVAFIKEGGILREFYTNEAGEEVTHCFFLENEFMSSVSSFTKQIPSNVSIQAISDTQLLVISKSNLEMLCKGIPVVHEFGRKEMEKIVIKMERRVSLFLTGSANERYQHLLINHPILLKTVQLNYLASYIGISPQHLSRLRKNLPG